MRYPILMGILVVLLGAGLANGGVRLEQRVEIEAVQVQGRSQPARQETRVIWLEPDRMAVEEKDRRSAVILRQDTQQLVFVDHEQRTWSAAPLPLQLPQELQRMIQTFRFQTDVRRTGQQKTIGDWKCEQILLTLTGYLNATVTVWATADLPEPAGRYPRLAAEMAAATPAMKGLMDQLAGLGDLFPVELEMQGEVMGARTRTVTRLVKAETVTIPATAFEPPAGYRQVPVDFLQPASR